MKKKLKFVVLLLAGFMMTGTMSACSDDDGNDIETVISENKLPESAKTFISTYYSSATVRSVKRELDNGVVLYEVDFTNGHEITFNSKGEWVEVDAPDGQSIPDGILPEVIQSYLDTNYQGYGVNDVTKTGAGYEVELVSGIDLLFDAQGDFIRIDR